MTITTFLDAIINGNLDTVRSQENINELVNAIGKITPKGYDLKALTLDVDNRINVQKKL